MKSLSIVLKLSIWLFPIGVRAQSTPLRVGNLVELVSPKGDTLSALLYTTKQGFGAKIQDKGDHVYIGWPAYRMDGKRVFYPRSARLYTLASGDPEISELYLQYHGNRRLYTVGAITGGALVLTGGAIFFADLSKNLLAEDSDFGVSGGLVLGGLFSTIVAIIGLEASLKNARKAVVLYNEKYIEGKSSVRFELGTSAFTPAGLVLRARF